MKGNGKRKKTESIDYERILTAEEQIFKILSNNFSTFEAMGILKAVEIRLMRIFFKHLDNEAKLK